MAGNLLYGDIAKEQQTWKPPTQTTMRDPKDLAAQYGITYDAATLEGKFNEATKAQYDNLRKEYQTTENKFYNNMYNNQQTALDTIRKSNAQAVATGASKGVQAANELSATLGLQQQTTEGATQLSADRNALMDKEQAAYAKNSVDALETANTLGLSLGNLNANLYASDTQFNVAQMDYYAKLDAALKQLQGMQEQANSNMYSADKNLEGNKYTADKNLEGNKYTADKNLEGNKYNSDKNLEGTKYTADKNLESARSRSYSGSSGYGGYSSYGGSGSGGYGVSAATEQKIANGIGAYKTDADKIAFCVANGMDYDSAKKYVGGYQNETWLNTVLSGTASGMTTEQAKQWANQKIYDEHKGYQYVSINKPKDKKPGASIGSGKHTQMSR